ncbi:MAG: AAA family ATPase [Acidimicrobiia bacterium]
MRIDWPLVGRGGELRLVTGLMRSSERRGVVLAGAAGVGKTRLLLECLAVAEQIGLPTARAAATQSAAHLPFGALAPLLPPPGPGLEAAEDQAEFLRRCCATLAERNGGERFVFFVDDAHLLDHASATLVHHLAVNGVAFVVATVRTGEPAPDPVVALWKDGLAERLDLTGLPSDAVEQLLGAVLGGPLDQAVVARMALRSQGNALYLRELVAGALDAGTLHNDGGIWRLADDLTPSDRLVELVEIRLSGLGDPERWLLEVLALGEPLGPAELRTLSGLALAETLERRGLLASRTNGRRVEVRLAHPLYGEVLRSRLTALRARSIASALAQAVEGTGARRREDSLRVGTWYLESGEGARGDLMLSAAAVAGQRYDFALAERLARAAVDAGVGFHAAFCAAQMAGFQGRVVDAEVELSAIAAQAKDDTQRGLVAVTRMDNLQHGLGRYNQALLVAEEAEATIADPTWRWEIAARRASILVRTEGPRAAVEAAAPVCREASGRALAWACLFSAVGMSRMGRVGEVQEIVDRGHDAALAQLGPPLHWPPEIFASMQCEALIHAGRLDEAEAVASDGYHQALDSGSDEMRGVYGWFLAKVLTLRGRVGTATQYGYESAALFRQLGRRPFLAHVIGVLAGALAVGGRSDEAATLLAESQSIDMPPKEVYAVETLQARAWLAVATGEIRKARQILEEAAALGEATGDVAGRVAALHDLARIGYAAAVSAALDEVVTTMEGDLPPARARYATARAANDASRLEEVGAAFEALGADLFAAEAAAEAAVVYRRCGELRQAAGAERRAALLATRCEGAVTPSLRAVEARALITAAEQEVALLASAGRSNKEIAEELMLSLRTVENYLHRVYEKLGISGRAELPSALKELSGVRST